MYVDLRRAASAPGNASAPNKHSPLSPSRGERSRDQLRTTAPTAADRKAVVLALYLPPLPRCLEFTRRVADSPWRGGPAAPPDLKSQTSGLWTMNRRR